MFDAGSTGFMLVCAMLVLLMTPGLAFFYGGLSRRKNVVNTMIMSFAVIGIVGVTWTVCGWSFAYGGDGSIPFFGGFDQIGLQGLVAGIVSEAPEALSHDAYPAMADVVFQLAFCMITTAIITGAVAGRMKFGAVCAFVAVWTVVVYPPLAHMVWGGEGSLVGDTIGALDFAGGVLTGLFCVPELSWTDFGGLVYTGDPTLLGAQVLGILVTVVFVGVLDVVLGFAVKACFKGSLRVSEAEEAQGLDVAAHGESAYPAYVGLD